MDNSEKINSNPAMQRDKRFDILLFSAGLLLVLFNLDSLLIRPAKNHNLLQLSITSDHSIVLIDSRQTDNQDSPKPSDYRPFFWDKIPINTAGRDLLMTVKGVGPDLAEKIIITRTSLGPFKNADDLQKIRGVGKKRASYFGDVFDFGDYEK
jgi:competence ComEA-like helix-hairpin-helix protein